MNLILVNIPSVESVKQGLYRTIYFSCVIFKLLHKSDVYLVHTLSK